MILKLEYTYHNLLLFFSARDCWLSEGTSVMIGMCWILAGGCPFEALIRLIKFLSLVSNHIVGLRLPKDFGRLSLDFLNHHFRILASYLAINLSQRSRQLVVSRYQLVLHGLVTAGTQFRRFGPGFLPPTSGIQRVLCSEKVFTRVQNTLVGCSWKFHL